MREVGVGVGLLLSLGNPSTIETVRLGGGKLFDCCVVVTVVVLGWNTGPYVCERQMLHKWAPYPSAHPRTSEVGSHLAHSPDYLA